MPPHSGTFVPDLVPDSPSSDVEPEPLTVLVVDDDDQVRAMCQAILESEGFLVLTAADGAKAVELFRDRGDEILVVLLDLMMPHLNGEGTLRRLREIRSDVPVVLSSGYTGRYTAQQISNLGLAGYLQKPYTLDRLVSSLREAVRSQTRR